MAEISINSLQIRYGNIEVLKKLDLTIGSGEFLVLLGSSGCGKSTLLNAIAGLIDVSAGEISIAGRNVTHLQPSDRGIAMVFQSYALYPKMSVRGNLAFALKVARVRRDEIDRRVNEVAEFLQLTNLLDRRPAHLSGGQRQRVAIGRALVRQAEVFLFDEPLSNLDAKLRADLRVEIKRLHRRLENTMIYVTHDQVEALTLADRIAVMKDGVIQQLGTPEDIYERPANRYVGAFIGSPSMNFVKGRLVTDAAGLALDSALGRLSLAGYPFLGDPPVGAEVELGLRPEHLELTDAGTLAPGAGFSAKVDVVENMGSESVIWAEAGDLPVALRVAGKRPLVPGQDIQLKIVPQLASVFDGATGERL